eukprot:GFUD01042429.1.p1 GENE.GFUD01042429.1~~GFUD01042429.1.p1  ORF type:complete len:510 (+),score=178.90 GFUD01042429.1:68-1597(+)
MGNTDSIPVVSQVKSLVQVIAGDQEAARKTQENFIRTGIIASQVNSAIAAANGDLEEARKIQEEFGKEAVNTLEVLPLIGHGMAAGYAIAGDLEKAEDVAIGATKSTVVAGSVVVSLACGPGAPVCAAALGSVAAVGTNAAWDGVESVVRKETVGVIKTVEDLVERNETHNAGEIFDISFGQASLAAGGAFGGFKVNKGANFKFVEKVGKTAKSTIKCICKREVESDTDPILQGVPPSLSQMSFNDQSVDGFIHSVVSIFIIMKLIFTKSSLATPYLTEICGAVGKKNIPLIECEEWLYDALDKYDNMENEEDGEQPSKTSLVIDSLSALVFNFDNMVKENMIGSGIDIWICSAATEVVENPDLLPDCVVKLQNVLRNVNLKFLPQQKTEPHQRFKRRAACCASPSFVRNHFAKAETNLIPRDYFWGRNTRILTGKPELYQKVFDQIEAGKFKFAEYKGKTQRVVRLDGLDMVDEVIKKGGEMVKERRVGPVDIYVSAANQLVHLQAAA